MAVKKTITKKQQNDYKKKCKASLIFDEDVPKTQEVLDEQEDKYFTEACHERDKKLQDIFNKCLCRMQMEIANTCCKGGRIRLYLSFVEARGFRDSSRRRCVRTGRPIRQG